MSHNLIAQFETRRAAETAVEHLVQGHKVDRTAISIRPAGSTNTAGTKPAGADAKPHNSNEGEPALEGMIDLMVQADDPAIEAVLREVGAKSVRRG